MDEGIYHFHERPKHVALVTNDDGFPAISTSKSQLLDECGVSMLPTLARLCHDLTKVYITGKAATTKIDRFLTRSSVLRGRNSFGSNKIGVVKASHGAYVPT